MSRWLGFLRSLVIYLNPWIGRRWRRFYDQLLSPGDLAFDVGAHMGTRARAMRSCGVKVIALEPQQPFAGFLRRTLPAGVTLIEAASGRTETEAEMAISSWHPTVSSLQADFVTEAATKPGFRRVRWNARQRVSVLTLDGLTARFGVPRYVKIDVEGYEVEVLAGLSHPVEFLSVEFLPGFSELTNAFMDLLAERGDYRFNPVLGESARFLWPQWKGAAATRQWLAGLSADSRSGDLFAKRAS